MKKIILVYNPLKPQAKKEAEEIKKYLTFQRINVSVFSSDVKSLPSSNLCITLGGDGTILKVAKKLIKSKTPILGINLGLLGFMAEIDQKEKYKIIGEILKGKLKPEKRMVLEIKINSKAYIAINDCVIHSGKSVRVILLKVKIDKHLLADYLGDGIIFATPTGSTAYSLAAGGPVVQPEVDSIVITPICPHILSQKSMVVSPSSVLTVEVPEYKSNKEIIVSIDGQENLKISSGDKLTIRKSEHSFYIFTHPYRNYCEILRTKLGICEKL
ncbi:MAG: NAD(+)/NADH kinase [Endomicrobiia bacterium]